MVPAPALLERFRADLAGIAPDARSIGVAVSGGGDSLALLLLARTALGEVRAATVDHRLRNEAAAEAAGVASLCGQLGVPHATLTVTVAPTGAGPQASARAARYAALAGWAARAGLSHVLTAHHLDDQAETLLMRLARGGGVRGLSGIRPRRAIERGVILLRPLLGWRRAELRAIVDAAGLVPVDDPSNSDPRYDRTAARGLLAANPALDPVRIARSVGALAEAEQALAWTAAEAARSRLTVSADGAVVDAEGLPPELQRRLLALALAELGAAPTGPEIDRLLDSLRTARPATIGDWKAIQTVAGASSRPRHAAPTKASHIIAINL